MKLKEICPYIQSNYVRIRSHRSEEVLALITGDFSRNWKQLQKRILEGEVTVLQPRIEQGADFLHTTFSALEIYVIEDLTV